jgi:MFS family permease
MAGQFQILTTVASDPGGLAKIYAGRVISGVGVGAISAVAPAYVSECSPKEVRGRITGLFQFMVKTIRYHTVNTIDRASRLLSAS